VGLPSRWVYPASKAAIEQVTRSQAMDLAADGIRVNAVMPGWTAKPWQESAPQEVKDQYAYWAKRLHMLGRLGRMEEVTDAVLSSAPSTPDSSRVAACAWTAGTAPWDPRGATWSCPRRFGR